MPTTFHTLLSLCTATAALCTLAYGELAHAQTVYRCGNTYSSVPCAGGTTVSTQPLVEVHPHQRTSNAAYQQQRKEDRDKQRLERELNKAQAAVPPTRSKDNRAQCEAKQRRIQKIDEMARKGGDAKYMERLREERQEARDWQFRAGC